jgi:hypothetical protein
MSMNGYHRPMAFRDPLEATAQRAAQLASEPVAPTHAWIAENVQLSIDPAPDGFVSPPEIVAAAERCGLRHVGRKSEGFIGRDAHFGDVFVEPTGRAFVSVRGKRSGGVIGTLGSKYWIMTVFDDATVLETSSLVEPIESSSERVRIRAGTGDLARDLAAHLAAVEARGPSAAVLPLRDHADVLVAKQIYFRKSISAELAEMMRVAKAGPILRLLVYATVKLERLFSGSKN